ncbi:hypothetical protein Cpir12675_004510 [Ceratocystis pirilliformis]|uniref:Amine oxidase domain-containing protein n=1 Tax=Ceratocystis pirilliformis TaxID=259994 RepID=A0ABR3YVX2_9PEZI
MKTSATFTSLVLGASAAVTPRSPEPITLETRSSLNSRVANVHLKFAEPISGLVTYTYSECGSEFGQHDHVVARTSDHSNDRLVWVMPAGVAPGGCLSAWSEAGVLLGRSAEQAIDHSNSYRVKRDLAAKAKRDGIAMPDVPNIDMMGPWFDGVAALDGKSIGAVNSNIKNKKIGILGAGMSGLMTYLVLHQAGFKNIEILEAAQRLGGRVHTEYLTGGPFDYSYQEMGPMRFPYQVVYNNITHNITDHQLVFQLATELNTLNNHNKNWSVDFIPWYQSNKNGLVYKNGFKLPSGLPPTVAQIAANASLGVSTVYDEATLEVETKVEDITSNSTFLAEIADNMFKAHSDFVANGLGGKPGDQWSEFAYMANYLGATLNSTDMLNGGSSSFWDSFYEGMYFSASTWKTIDGGLSRLPGAFHPLVDKVVRMNRRVEAVENKNGQVNVKWREHAGEVSAKTSTYDYAVVAVPFSIVKRWRLPKMETSMKNAITKLNYNSACKVALEFSHRFWEHYENPIYGGCSTTSDIPGVGTICYPSYNINGTGPASMLASYISGTQYGLSWAAAPEVEHVNAIKEAIFEIHGDVARKSYTGKYNRRCWANDEYQAGSWASPTVGQHETYIPEYFKTHNNLIFVGEHTSYTHAWIASALEAGVRGSVQLMLELGLVDEAKAATEKWMARWIEV